MKNVDHFKYICSIPVPIGDDEKGNEVKLYKVLNKDRTYHFQTKGAEMKRLYDKVCNDRITLPPFIGRFSADSDENAKKMIETVILHFFDKYKEYFSKQFNESQ